MSKAISVQPILPQTDQCECIGVLRGHSDYINCILIEDCYVLTGSADKTVRKWDVGTCECLLTCIGHSSVIYRYGIFFLYSHVLIFCFQPRSTNVFLVAYHWNSNHRWLLHKPTISTKRFIKSFKEGSKLYCTIEKD